MISRNISSTIKRYIKSFPVVLLTGARQVGKTTTLKSLLSNDYNYVLLEDPDVRELANIDPRRFLEQNKPPVIFDEFQLVPNLTSYLQGIVDKNRSQKGRFVLTGSQNFLMMEQITQSLAGRIGIIEMYGLNSAELPKDALDFADESLGNLLLRGTYPELWADRDIKSNDWFGSYVQTYLERDVRRIANVGDIVAFERFLKVCATRTGQTLNYSDLASDAGVTHTTAQRWISILQATYIVKLVQPYFENISSRVKKAPKLYFLDVGLASYLMGFKEPLSVIHSPQYGALFESLVYADFIKKTSSAGEIPSHFYLQSRSKIGVDLILQNENKLNIIEIKGAKTFSPSLCESLIETKKVLKNKVSRTILLGAFQTDSVAHISGIDIEIKPWHKL